MFSRIATVLLPVSILLLLVPWQQAGANSRDSRVPVLRDPNAVDVDAIAPPSGAVKPREMDDVLARVGEALRTMQPDPPDYGAIGGEDVIAAWHGEFWGAGGVSMDIAETGEIFVAMEREGSDGRHSLIVYKSIDGGQTWISWGVIYDGPDGYSYSNPSLHVAGSKVFVAYRKVLATGDGEVNVRYANVDDLFASFAVAPVMSQTGVDFDNPCLTSDAVSFSAYYLYLIAEGDDGDGNDIWFTRSITQSASWDTEYKIASLSAGDRDYREPKVTYGRNGQLHAVWYFDAGFTTPDWAIRYRRALNWVAAGEPDWESVVYLTPNNDGSYEHSPVVAASHTTDRVVIGYGIYGSGPTVEDSRFWPSYDAGVTWNIADTTDVGGDLGPIQLLAKPDGEGFLYVGRQDNYPDIGIRQSDDVTPLSWSNHQLFMDRSYPSDTGVGTCRLAAVDPSRDNKIAMTWLKDVLYTGPDTLFFDAEWRGEPGFPTPEPGFPISLPAGVVSPPGICELDGDMESEIVFGDENGFIHAYNHDGSVLSGWPNLIGTIPHDSPVAVGDLNGDGHYEVICGNSFGYVYAFSDNGDLFPGWPVSLGSTDSVYVSIGKLTESSYRQVVACVGNSLFLLSADGSVEPGFPQVGVGPIRASAAIGDVDDNGLREIVILQESFMNVITGTGGSQAHRDFTGSGKTFKNSPTLADLDMNGDLEIVAPTEQGDIYVMTKDGNDYPGWPVSYANGGPATSVALANIRAGMEPELVFASRDIFLHAYYEDGVVLSGFPVFTTGSTVHLGMPILDPINDTSGDIILPVWDYWAYAWSNFGHDVSGWPATVWGESIVSAATGDIDADDNLEVVVTTYTNPNIMIWDVGYPPRRNDVIANRWWPMYAYNSQRQGCLFCEFEDVVVPVDEGLVTSGSVRFSAPAPNPAVAEVVTLAFELPGEAAVRLTMFDVTGRRVRQVVREEMDAGAYTYSWDGRDDRGSQVPAGNYYARLTVGGVGGTQKIVRKVVLLR